MKKHPYNTKSRCKEDYDVIFKKRQKRIKIRDLSKTIKNEILFGIKWSLPEMQPFKIRLKGYFIRTTAQYKPSLLEWTQNLHTMASKRKRGHFEVIRLKFSTFLSNISTYIPTSITSGVHVFLLFLNVKICLFTIFENHSFKKFFMNKTPRKITIVAYAKPKVYIWCI